MNQTRIFRLAKIYLQETDMPISEALEPQVNDRINQPWSYDKMDLIFRAKQTTLTEEKERLLQQTLADSLISATLSLTIELLSLIFISNLPFLWIFVKSVYTPSIKRN